MKVYYVMAEDDRKAPHFVARRLLQELRATQGMSILVVPYGARDFADDVRPDDVIHVVKSPSARSWESWLIARARSSGCHLIWHLHGDYGTEAMWAVRDRNWLEAARLLGSGLAFVRRARHIGTLIVHSPSMAASRLVRESVVTPFVVALGVDQTPPTPARRNRSRSVFFHGVLSRRKGFDLLLAALETEPLRDVELRVAGDGPLRGELKQWSARRSRPARWVRYLDQQAIRRELSEAGCAAYPSRFEPFGLAYVEALAWSGAAVVGSTAIGALGFMATTSTDSLLLAEPTLLALSAALGRALDEPDAIVTKQVVAARQFTWAATAASIIRAYARPEVQ